MPQGNEPRVLVKKLENKRDMRLSKIRLAGFKSFVDPTTIQFPSQLIGVVGPNGCGKSNVIDAVRWVMGESSAKHLRGESMEDVIFNGSNTRQPVGQASVELVFDNTAGQLGGQYAQYNEISIKRQVSRDGQSNYYLNSSRCRRRDITDIFLGTGLGPRSYAIIEQGMISRLIEAKPEELRVYLEEAAGISKYKERRRETENRIRHTRENMDLLEVTREEVEKQLEHLKRQANAAERYKDFKSQEHKLKAELLALRWREQDDDFQKKQQLLSEKETQLEAIVAEQRKAEAEMEQARERLAEVNEAFNEVQGKYYGVGADISRVEQSILHHKESTEQYRGELTKLETAWRESKDHIEQDRARLQELRESIAADEPQHEARLQDQETAQSELGKIETEINQWQSQWEDFNRRASEPAKVAEVQQARISQLEKHHQQVDERLQKLNAERQQLGSDNFDESLQQANEALAAAQAAEVEQQATLDTLNQAIQSKRSESEQSRLKLQETNAQLQTLGGRLSSAEALQEAALGKSDAALNDWLDTHQLSQLPRLVEQLKVEAGWERAVETALGHYLEAVCVPEGQDYEKILSDLEQGEIILVEASSNNVLAADNSLLSKVEAPASVKIKLAKIRVAFDLSEALSIRDSLAEDESVITPRGEWLGKHWLRISHQPEEEAGVLAREQEIKRLQSELEILQQSANELETARQQLNQQLENEEAEREQGLQALNQAHRSRAENEGQLKQLESRKQQAEQRSEQLNKEIEELRTQIATDTTEMEQAHALLEQASQSNETLDSEREKLIAQKQTLQESLQQARNKTHADRDAGHQIAMRMQSMRSSEQEIDQNLQRSQRQQQQLAERREELLKALTDGEQPAISLQKELDALLQDRVGAEKQLNEARAGMEVVEAALRTSDEQRHSGEKRANEVRIELEQQRMAWQELKVRRQTIEEQLSETEFDRETLLQELAVEAKVNKWQESVEAMGRKIQRLGPINLAAIDEYKEYLQRKEYLDMQFADINEALETLEAAIAKIDKETRERFKTTFELVSDRLKEFFPRLFGGGHAHLEMTGNDLLSTGVAVMARPPGKRVSNIHLLSGGEKAMTAVALVFAFFELNPAPFCMLDEVDAPLDDANVARFCALVKEMSSRVQFIFITHNKATMELSEQLMGVTMQEPGVSRLVAVDVQEAAQMATG